MSRDQKFFDMYSLVIGVLGAVALAILVLAMKMSDLTQGVYTRDGDEYRAAVQARIKPVGEVYLPGQEIASGATIDVPEGAAPVATVLSGPQVYNEACISCHGAGIAGAPVIGDTAAWAGRIEQGIDVLNEHAINGFGGSTGYMPAKGGRMDLSDAEIVDAVEYMVAESQ